MHIILPDKDAAPDTERVYRLTVDGVPRTQVVGIEENGGGVIDLYYIGNIALWYNAYSGPTTPDDGTAFCIFASEYSSSLGLRTTCFVSRDPGTYHIKVERLLKDPVAYSYNGTRLPQLPKSGYACILTSQTGAARLVYPSRTTGFYYSAQQELFTSQKYDRTVECYRYDPIQGDTNWV